LRLFPDVITQQTMMGSLSPIDYRQLDMHQWAGASDSVLGKQRALLRHNDA
jgi:hypothetical protein